MASSPTRDLNTASASRTDQIDTQPVTDDQLLTPIPPLDDIITPRATLEDIALPPEEAATQFTPPPVFDSSPGETKPAAKKPKFVKSGTLPGVIAPKKKSDRDH